MTSCILLALINLQLRYSESPFEYIFLCLWRLQTLDQCFWAESINIGCDREIVVSKPIVKILFRCINVVRIDYLSVPHRVKLNGNQLFRLCLIIEYFRINQMILTWNGEYCTQERNRYGIILQFVKKNQSFSASVEF